MVRKIVALFISWLAFRKVDSARRMVRDCKVGMDRSLRSLEKHRKQLKGLEKRLGAIAESTMDDLDEASNLQGRWEEAMEALRSKTEIYEQITKPLMAQEWQLMLERYKADTAIAVRRQAGALERPDNEAQL